MHPSLQAILTLLLVAASPAPELRVQPGAPVPNLAARWIRGDPVTKFDAGRVYVLEFWSTWCGGCIASIPELNRLARQFSRDATFIALHVWPQQSAPQPEDFLAKRAAAGQPVYELPVALDVDGALARCWLDATETTGLPTAMIIDRQSRLVWFGDVKDLERSLDQVVAGTIDVAGGVDAMKRRIQVGRLAKESDRAIEAKNFDQAAALMTEAVSIDPDAVAPWVPSTYGHLFAVSGDRAVAASFVDKIKAGPLGNRPDVLAGFADVILHFQPADMRDLDFAGALAEQATRASEFRDARVVLTLADIRLEQDNRSGAIEALQRGVAAATDDKARTQLTKKLETVRAKQGN